MENLSGLVFVSATLETTTRRKEVRRFMKWTGEDNTALSHPSLKRKTPRSGDRPTPVTPAGHDHKQVDCFC